MDLQRARSPFTLACLLSFSVAVYTIRSSSHSVDLIGSSGSSSTSLILYGSAIILAVFAAAVVLAAARATMVAWITVLVLLAFVGNRRRVLARQGRRITADVAVHLVKVLMRERGILAVVFAAVVSFVAVIGVREM